ncbi:hypothetical protein [Sulfitobacter marinus]|nr:hypothetical protein [Sulfitobacter marinus]
MIAAADMQRALTQDQPGGKISLFARTLLIVAALWTVSSQSYYALVSVLGLERGYDGAPILFAAYYLGWAALAAWLFRALFANVLARDRVAREGLALLLILAAFGLFVVYALPLLPDFSEVRAPGNPPEFIFASAWGPARRAITFISKALGDYTEGWPDTVKAGDAVIVEGQYGRFTFDNAKERQIWIRAGIGITPFIARLNHLVAALDGKKIDPFHTAPKIASEPQALLEADVAAAGVKLQLMRDGTTAFSTVPACATCCPTGQMPASGSGPRRLWPCAASGSGRARPQARGLSSETFQHGLTRAHPRRPLMTIKSINGCIGCEECVKSCPCDVIRMEGGKAVITYAADCQICHLCRMYCPVDAIEMSPEKSIPVIVPWG